MKPCQVGKYNSLSLRASEGRNPSERSNLFLFAITIAVFAFCFFGVDFVFAASNTTLDFDGTSDYLVASDNAVFDQADRLSISVWIQPDDTPGGDEYIVYRFNDYYLKIDSSRKIIASVHTDAETVTSVSAITCDGVEWTHVEMTYDKDVGGTDELKLYIDGVLDGVGDYSTANAVSDEKLYIGAADIDGIVGGDGVTNWFDGKIDDVRLYQYARSASDVRLDYNDGLAARFGGLAMSDISNCSLDPASCMDHGLVGHWNMDEAGGDTLYDQSDNGNDGTLGSGAGADTSDPKWVSGESSSAKGYGGSSGTALRFDGENDYVNCGNDSSLDITDAITIEAWVKIDSFDNYAGIVSKIENVSEKREGYEIRMYAGTSIRMRIGDTTDGGIEGTNNITLGIWQHVVGVYNGSQIVMYVNGSAGTPVACTKTIVDSGNSLMMGKEVYTNWLINGSIDGVKIYNRALSAEEIRYHYNRGGPVGHWKFDEGEGAKAYDESGNRNHGTFGDGTCLPGAGKCPTWVAGKHASALSFDGTDDYVDISSDIIGTTATQAFTVSAWVKTSQLSDYLAIWDQSDTSGDYRHNYFYVMADGGILAFIRDQDLNFIGSQTSSVTATGLIIAGQWHYVVKQWDGAGTLKVFVDGNEEYSSTNTSVDGDISGSSWIGKASDDVDVHKYFFNGTIDDVKIYNYARTQEQILIDYNAGLGTHIK